MTFLVNNYDQLSPDPEIQENLAKARSWESAFVSFMKNYTSSPDKPDFMDVAFNSERSIEDELERTSTGIACIKTRMFESESLPIAHTYLVIVFLLQVI